MKRVGKTLAKIGLTLLCLLVPSISRENGTTLGAIPTVIIYLPVFYALFRIWKKNGVASHNAPIEAEFASVTEPEHAPITPDHEIAPIAPRKERPIAQNRMHVIVWSLAVVSAISIGVVVYFAVTASDLRKEVSAQKAKINTLTSTITRLRSENEQLSLLINELRYEPKREETTITTTWIDTLNLTIDGIRNGSKPVSWREYRSTYIDTEKTIQNMFRDVKRDDISRYFDEVYYLKTDLYPLEYFKEKGFIYTGDVIEGWEP